MLPQRWEVERGSGRYGRGCGKDDEEGWGDGVGARGIAGKAGGARGGAKPRASVRTRKRSEVGMSHTKVRPGNGRNTGGRSVVGLGAIPRPGFGQRQAGARVRTVEIPGVRETLGTGVRSAESGPRVRTGCCPSSAPTAALPIDSCFPRRRSATRHWHCAQNLQQSLRTALQALGMSGMCVGVVLGGRFLEY